LPAPAIDDLLVPEERITHRGYFGKGPQVRNADCGMGKGELRITSYELRVGDRGMRIEGKAGRAVVMLRVKKPPEA